MSVVDTVTSTNTKFVSNTIVPKLKKSTEHDHNLFSSKVMSKHDLDLEAIPSIDSQDNCRKPQVCCKIAPMLGKSTYCADKMVVSPQLYFLYL